MNGTTVPSEALIDSGADLCIFDAELADIFGIDVTKGEPRSVAGIEGVVETQYIHPVKLTIGGWEHDIQAGFLPGIARFGYGLLGQQGFFEFFKVAFDYPKESIDVKPYR